MARTSKNAEGANPSDSHVELTGNTHEQEDPNPVLGNEKQDAANHELAQAAQEAAQAPEDDREEAARQVRQREQELRAELTAEEEGEDAAAGQAIRDLVYETANKVQGGTVRPMGPEGAPLTDFERESNWFFKQQNAAEKKIDAIKPSRESQALFAGTPVNVFQTAEAGDLNVGSATVTTYVGETINPYPPTDYGTNAIVAGDLTTDPILANLGLVAGNPMPPENNVSDIRETDGRIDTKDFMRRLRQPNDLIVESRRTKYPSTEAPA
jgi:hypothetical protein